MVKKILEKSYLAIIMALLYAPIILIIVFSFSNSSNFRFDEGFTFESYISIFTSEQTPELLEAVKNTFLIAIIASVAATILGSIAAVGIFSLGKKMRRAVENVNQLPIINSEIVMAVSLMLFFVTFGFPAGYVRIIIGHIAFCTPYVVLSVMPRLVQMDPNVYEAALDLGAGPVKALFKVLAHSVLLNFVVVDLGEETFGFLRAALHLCGGSLSERLHKVRFTLNIELGRRRCGRNAQAQSRTQSKDAQSTNRTEQFFERSHYCFLFFAIHNRSPFS